MSSYTWLKITAPEDYKQLAEHLDEEFQPKNIADQLQKAITDDVGTILIERGYIDKDYRSTFYNFYAKQGRPYRDDCVRLHFFEGCVEFDPTRTDLVWPDDRLEDHYFGYVVLRPTVVATLGRSTLSPKVRVGARGTAIQSRHRVHLLGYTLSVWGFPSMAQHTDIAVCAHVSCWAILRHYSERFPQHREFLVHDVTRLAAPFDPGGLTPSLGLNILEAERIFEAAGCFPLIVGKGQTNGSELRFYAQLLAYLESGFPLFVAMIDHGHALVVAGYAWRPTAVKPPYAFPHVWSQVESLLTIDDNRLPYDCIALEPTTASPGGSTYTVEDFDAFIVPLPEKIFYSAASVELYLPALHLLLKNKLKLPDEDKLLRRYFITTVSALRRYARKHQSQLGDELVHLLMCLKTAQFIWVVEFATAEQWDRRHIAARAIVDATASPRDPLPVCLSHDEEIAIVFDRASAKVAAEFLELKRPADTPLGRMEQNLRPVKA